MGPFRKKNAGFVHSIIDIIKFEGPPDVLVWKHDSEDFNNNSQLIVMESQEVVLMKNGQALQVFPPGRYTLSVENYPFIRSLIGLVTGGVSPFQCSVYFVNKAISMGIEWGTNSPIRMNDPVHDLPVNITAFGDFSVQVIEPKQLLFQLVATTKGFTQEELTTYFRGILASRIRTQITLAMTQNKISALGIDAYLDDIATLIFPELEKEYSKYGLRLNHFAIENIGYTGLEEVEQVLHDEKVKDIGFYRETERTRTLQSVEAEGTIKHGEAVARINKAQGITELHKKMIDVAVKQAENPGPIMQAPGIALGFYGGNAVAGYGSGLKTTGANATESLKVIAGLPLQGEDSEKPTFDGSSAGDFGETVDSKGDEPNDFAKRVEKLKMMKDSGLLSAEEFACMKQKLLEEIYSGDEK
ncbi:MAG: SPFH domain-containing protein [Clostridia bacterium]|nr:SPFH domain-containing protein [Clostridia bacterium]